MFENTDRGFMKREIVAAATTFLTMSYILVANPAILKDAGIPYDSVFAATAISAAIACILMGLLADRPFALASGMGLNAYFAYSVIGGMGFSYGAALLAVLGGAIAMTLFSLMKIDFSSAVPESFKHALIGGLGLFLVFIGMQNAHFVVANSATIVALGNLGNPSTMVALFGLAITLIFLVRKTEGAFFIGMLGAVAISFILGVSTLPDQLLQTPPDIGQTFMKIDFGEV
ncbi:MAG: NCS2 family permease, partial [Candidatus Micrarchaeia archaeon]